MTIPVLIADDHAGFRPDFRAILDTQDDIVCVAEAGDGEQAVKN